MERTGSPEGKGRDERADRCWDHPLHSFIPDIVITTYRYQALGSTAGNKTKSAFMEQV